MKNTVISILLFLVVPVNVIAHSGTDTQNKPSRRMEGIWICRFPKTVLREGIDRVIELKFGKDFWTISFTTIGYRSIDRRPYYRKSVRGPFKAQIKDGILTFVENGKKIEYTIRMEGDNLVIPAFVKSDEKTWIMKRYARREGKTTTTIFQCESDYTKVPVGRAFFPSVERGRVQRFYTYERGDYDPKRRTHTKYLRFFFRLSGGTLAERGRLIWDERGSPRFDGRSMYGKEDRYVRVTEDKLIPNRIPKLTDEDKLIIVPNRVAGDRPRWTGPGSHTTVHAGPHTAVPD